MTLDVKRPEPVGECAADDIVEIDDEPTVESPIPCFDEQDDVMPGVGPTAIRASDEQDDVVPDVDDPDVRDARMVDVSRIDEARRSPPHREERRNLLRRIRQSARLQLALLSLVGVAILVPLFSMDSSVAETSPPPPSSIGRFPTLEVEGARPVTEEEIARRMRSAPPETLDRDALVREELEAIADAGREMVDADDVSPSSGARARPPARGTKTSGRRRGRVEKAAGDETKKKERARVGRWFSPGGTMKVDGALDDNAPKKLPLGVGDRLSAKLEVGISSGHAAPVLARLAKAVTVDGRVVAPEGAIAKGSFGSDGRRIYLNFSELVLADGARLTFEGYAVDRKIPGLIAIRRELPADESSRDGVVDETMDVAKEVVRSVAGGSIVGRVAQGVAEGVLPEKQGRQESGVILELEAGTRFEIVVTGESK